MPRTPAVLDRPLTPAERQAHYRAKQQARIEEERRELQRLREENERLWRRAQEFPGNTDEDA